MKIKLIFSLFPLLLICSCSLRTVQQTTNTFSRNYSLRFVEDELGNELDIKDLFVTAYTDAPTYIHYRFNGTYELSINYKIRNEDSFVSSGKYNVNSTIVKMVESDKSYAALLNYPNYEKYGPQYILYLGLQIEIYADNTTSEKTPVVMWFWSNIFVPEEEIPEITIN